MKKRSFALIFLAGLCLSPCAQAAFTGEDLLKRCSAAEKSMHHEQLSAEEALDSMWCVGYLSGLLDGFGVSDYKIDDHKMICPTEEGLSKSNALTIIMQYLRDHPEEQQKNGRRSALVALSRALPCK
jgi:hypothetical protein